MATFEHSGVLAFKDENGDKHLLYPVTNMDCVDGMDDVIAHLSDKNNPHGVTASQVEYAEGVTVEDAIAGAVKTAGDAKTAADNAASSASSALGAAQTAQAAADKALEAISKLAFTIDAVPSQSGSLAYNGGMQSPTWNSYNPETLTLGGQTSGTDAGTYTVIFTPKEGYTWSDGTSDAREVVWTIGRAPISVIPSQNGSLIYNGAAQSPSWDNYDSSKLILGGATSATNAGSHDAAFTPTANYRWSDGTTEAKSVPWVIDRAAITAMPEQKGALTYSGKAQSPAWSNYDTAKMTAGGTTSGTNAGSYDADFTPTSNYKWSDGSTGAKTVSWSIGKAAGNLSLDKSSLSLGDSATTGVVTATRAGDGTVSAASSNTGIATVSVSGNKITVTAKSNGSVQITVKVAAGTNHTAPADQIINVVVAFANVFGVCWNYGASSTALSRLTKSNDPNGLVTTNITTEPVPAVGTGAGSSPFDSYAPWKDMDEYNIVNNAVSHKRGASGFSRTSHDTVVFIPEYYFKIVDDATNKKRYFYVCDKAKSGFATHPGSGKYVGRYNTISGNYSKSGAAPLVNITRATARSGAKGKGSKWSEYDYASWCAVWLLYLVEFADWDSQGQIGRGYVDDNSSAIKSGGTDSMNYHTGRASGTDGKTAVQYRHIENPWGNVREFIDGINFSDGTVYVCTNPANYADDTATNYTNIGTKAQSDGYIKSLGMSGNMPWAFFPTATGGSETTYVPDYAYYDSGWRVLNVGGNWNNAGKAGLFYFNANNTSSNTNSNLGARPLVFPMLAQTLPHRTVKILPHRTGLSRFNLDQPCRQTRTGGPNHAETDRLPIRQDGRPRLHPPGDFGGSARTAQTLRRCSNPERP